MSINTDLNVDPYFDDFDPEKQYHRVLFKPARAVQARELTQLQSILQNQIERFGLNIYQEGTIITGVNITQRFDLFYVKLIDQDDFTDPEAYKETAEQTYTVTGQTSGLVAEIVEASNGFQTRDPDLKTFYIRYKNSSTVDGDEVKQFIAGETLAIKSANGQTVQSVSVATTLAGDHVGRSFGISVEEGVVFQKGHFIYVEPQTVIVSKYTNVATNVSVGFEITENLINSGIDQTLLDPASGFNNENAPGADRLQLKPELVAYQSNNAPDEFFALIKFERGNAISIRDVTQFNSVNEAMARRTYDESGSYVARGMNVTTTKVQETDENDNPVLNTYAVVGAGKAYPFGREVNNLANRYLQLDPSTDTIVKENQGFGAQYDSYYTYDDAGAAFVLNLDGTRYSIWGDNEDLLGSCSIRNITKDRIYVYGINRISGKENLAVARIGATYASGITTTSTLINGTKGSFIFDIGNRSLKSVTDISYVRRRKVTVGEVDDQTGAVSGVTSATLQSTDSYSVLTNDNMVAVDVNNNFVNVQAPQIVSGNVTVTFDSPAAYLYHDILVSTSTPDVLTPLDVYVNIDVATFNSKATLGLPNCVKLLEVTKMTTDPGTQARVVDEDVTSQFQLVRNQKDAYYDLSYVKLKPGADAGLVGSDLRVKVTALRRTSSAGNLYLTADSYINVDKELIQPYTQRDGTVVDLFSAMDFRPYANPGNSYSVGAGGAPEATEPGLTFSANFGPPDGSTIIADIENYLDRRDVVGIDQLGKFKVIKGASSENPVLPIVTNVFPLAELFIPGGPVIKLTGPNPLSLKSVATPGYTMKEINNIDKSVKRLTETVSLTLLEQSTNDLFIPDANGNDRFKNGILVDAFKNLDIAEISDPDYSAAVDKTFRIATPAITQFPIDLKFDSGSNVSASTGSPTTFRDVVTLQPETSTGVTFLEQQYATNFRNAASNQYGFKGRMIISPQYDSGYDVVNNPAVNVDIDIATPLLDLVDNIQEFVPLTRSSSSSRSARNSTRVAGGTRVTTSTTTTTTTDSLEGNATEATDIVAGDFITDFEFKPYMQSREIRVLITGLRPNTLHSLFFDETNVNEHTFNASNGATYSSEGQVTGFEVTNVDITSNTPATNGVQTDANGVLSAVFIIPENTFFVGETELLVADVDQFDSFESGRTSYSRTMYRAYNFGVNKTELSFTTRSVDFDVETTVTTSTNTSSRFIADPPPVPRSCFVKGTMVALADGTEKKIEEVELGDRLCGQDGAINNVLEFDHPMLGGRDLIGINGGGVFMTPEHPVYTKDGWKAPRMVDTLDAYPHLDTIMMGDLEVGDEIETIDGGWVLVESIEVYSDEEDQQVFNFILDGNNTYYADGLLVHNRDPLSQTFFVKSSMADQASNLFLSEIDLFFKRKSETNGITVQIREVENGYPSYTTLPFATKYVHPNEVAISDDGSSATTVHFDNPIKLDVEKEYCFVVIPEQIDPNYLLYTSKVGGTDLNSGAVIAQDWGDGVLFTSTNDRAWRSYQDEDIKFALRKYEFSENTGYADLKANDSEFFTIQDRDGNFRNDELVYGDATSEIAIGNVSIVNYDLNGEGVVGVPSGVTSNFAVGDYILLTKGDDKFLSLVRRTNIDSTTGVTYIYTSPITIPTTNVLDLSASLVPVGRVSYFNSRRGVKLYLRESSARNNVAFQAEGSLTGYRSGATATITTVDNIPLSYIQPMIATSNSLQTSTALKLMNGSTVQRDMPFNDATYLTDATRYIESKSNVVIGQTTDNFKVRVDMSNSGQTSVTPIVDEDLAMLNAYQYRINTSPATTSQYVSKEVVLQPDMDAVGLKVLLSAYRPAGTIIDIYARFTYETNPDAQSDWKKLNQAVSDLYSNTNNVRDYREFEYNFDETANGHSEYTSFQLRIVMRHMTTQEMTNANLTSFFNEEGNFVPEVNLFAHLYDYRAIALT